MKDIRKHWQQKNKNCRFAGRYGDSVPILFYAIGNFVPENYAVMFLHILAKSENICKIEYRINEIGRE